MVGLAALDPPYPTKGSDNVNRLFALVCLIVITPFAAPGEPKLPKPMISGLRDPGSVCVAGDGRVFVTEVGHRTGGDGRVMVIDKTGKAVPFAIGLDNPGRIVAWTNLLYVADNKRVRRIDLKGKVTVFADEKAFPRPPL